MFWCCQIASSNNQWLCVMYQLVLNKEDILLHCIVYCTFCPRYTLYIPVHFINATFKVTPDWFIRNSNDSQDPIYFLNMQQTCAHQILAYLNLLTFHNNLLFLQPFIIPSLTDQLYLVRKEKWVQRKSSTRLYDYMNSCPSS